MDEIVFFFFFLSCGTGTGFSLYRIDIPVKFLGFLLEKGFFFSNPFFLSQITLK